jgi:regulator of sigma D
MTLLELIRSTDTKMTIEEGIDLVKQILPKIRALGQPLQDINDKYTNRNLRTENMGAIMDDIMGDLSKIVDVLNAR